MANLYGVASPNPYPLGLGTIGSADVVCSAGVETNAFSGQAPLPSLPGWYYPGWWGQFAITFGASVPTLVTVASRLNNGADIGAMLIHGGLYIANASLIVPVAFYAPLQAILNPTGTWNFQVSVNATVNGVTVRQAGGYMNVSWFRAPDQ